MAATALLLERTESEQYSWSDWEAPAGGLAALPRLGRLSFTYRGRGDDHWVGQGCVALESVDPAQETLLVAFACGCRARVYRFELHSGSGGGGGH